MINFTTIFRYFKRQKNTFSELSLPDQSINKIILYAGKIITFLAKIKYINKISDIYTVRSYLLNELKNLERNLLSANYPPKIILATRYCLITALDEAIMNSSWGTKSIWIEESLLSLIHKETHGGERFFIILEQFSLEPELNIELLELIFILLKLGFQGKYMLEGQIAREEIIYRLMQLIKAHTTLPLHQLSQQAKDPLIILKNQRKRISLEYIVIMTISIFLTVTTFYNYKLYKATQPVLQKIRTIK